VARFSGQVAVVTGAARGIGQAIAKRLADDGAQVYGLDVQDFVASDAAITPRHVDVRDAESIQHTVNDIMGRLGRIDVWVNNAGVYSNGSIQAMSISDWRMALDINLTGAMCCIQAVVPPMIAQHYGRIVNISSIAGLIGFPESIAYGTTKTALIGLTRAAAVDLGPYGITVNAICPGSILTEMQMQVDLAISTRNGWPPGTFNTQRTAEIPLRRLGNPEDVAGVVAFLASPDAAYMTGQTLIVDGGLMPI
jgi:NAD(P)-dependent dehydrogenase (short-subunit alcohol dehydrogenase family)